MNKDLVEIVSSNEEGYLPLVDFEKWRVAQLRYIDELEVDNLKDMQKHNETDEIFVLLEGDFTLFTGGNDDEISEIEAIKLEPLKVYNVKKGTFHTHTPEKNATVLIVENVDTNDSNSTKKILSSKQKAVIKELYQKVNGMD